MIPLPPPDLPEPASETAGFTLVETLVALAVLAIMLLAFYQFLASALGGAAAAERAAIAYDRRQNALALAATLNPMEHPAGSFDLGSYRIRWRSQAIGIPRRNSGFVAGSGRFIVGLYRVVLDFPGEPGDPAVEVVKLGYRSAAQGKASGEPVN
jgi:prepilin-type N-terminal cleavage/methylation domain-containing protein